MMGRTHALSGALAGLAAAPALGWATPGLAPHGHLEVAVFATATAGAALVPDLDHPSATIARAYGPVSHLLSRAVHRIAGGHRGATHSVPGVLLAAGLGGLAGSAGGWWAWSVVTVLVALAAAALGLSHPLPATVATGALVAAGAWVGVEFGPWLGAAVGIGAAAHVVGDCATVSGCPLWWPRPRRYRIAAISTDSTAEHVLSVALVLALAGAMWLSGIGGFVTGHSAPSTAIVRTR